MVELGRVYVCGGPFFANERLQNPRSPPALFVDRREARSDGMVGAVWLLVLTIFVFLEEKSFSTRK